MVSEALITFNLEESISNSFAFSLISSSGPTKVIDNSGNSLSAQEAPKIMASGPLSEPKASITILYCAIDHLPFH